MRHVIVVPATPDGDVPAGAAVIQHAPGLFLVCSASAAAFGERCAQALHHGNRVRLTQVTEIGWFDDFDGQVRLNRQGAGLLGQWLGHPVYLNDLAARDNRAERRQRARRLMLQGRLAEAYRLDGRFGL